MMATRRVRETSEPGTSQQAQSILLDSHVWYWYVDPAARPLAPSTLALIDAARETGEAFISHVTPWELASKASLGRLSLDKPAKIWMEDALRASGFSEIPLTLDILLDAACLERGAPRDPMDRLLVATARRHGCTLLTADGTILEWARRTRAVRVVRAR